MINKAHNDASHYQNSFQGRLDQAPFANNKRGKGLSHSKTKRGWLEINSVCVKIMEITEHFSSSKLFCVCSITMFEASYPRWLQHPQVVVAPHDCVYVISLQRPNQERSVSYRRGSSAAVAF